jgi:uncharacterized protein with ATP-grasp and redox domains
MKTYFECLPCFVRQALDAARQATDDEKLHETILRKVLHAAGAMDLSQPTPVMIGVVHRLVRETTGSSDPYRSVKDLFNRSMMALYPEYKDMIQRSADPVDTALRLAVAGNTIDFVVSSRLDEVSVAQTLAHAVAAQLPTGAVETLRQSVEAADQILYLGDNAGEIVFDRLLIEQLEPRKITFVVKGGPVVNDVTLADAQSAGMSDVVEVIDNGSDIPGTVLPFCSEAFRNRFEAADLVISKGQGNYESLDDIDKHMIFVFKAKCHVMTLHLGYPIDTPVLLNTKA